MVTGERIIAGISGGVDSAVAALRLKQAGCDVQGLHMTNWEDDAGYCSAADDLQAARAACRDLGIVLHEVSFTAQYREQVFADFLREYAAGRTPNPDVLCNRYIKFGAFLEHARRLGASRIATGHYARIAPGASPRLLMAADRDKDQTYFLHAVESAALSHTLFPIGDLRKHEVRALANEAGLRNWRRPDSTGICFIGEQPFREFLQRYLQGAPGPVLTPEGERLGEHAGLMFHTLGQRSGIGIGGRSTGSAEPWYVAGKDIARNALIVVQGRSHPMLWSAALHTGPIHWIDPQPASGPGPWSCQVRIRHRHVPAPATVSAQSDGALEIHFREPQWAVAPGQYAVLYAGTECLGGGVIEQAL